MSKKERLPQNMVDVLKDIGENAVLFQLFVLTHGTDWTIFKNLSDRGCDIIMQNFKLGDDDKGKISIEVKARQKLYSSISHKKDFDKRAQFNLTQSEYNNCDFLIAYWFDHNSFFIVPKEDLKKVGSKTVKYRFEARRNTEGFSSSTAKYQNWELIKARIAE